MRGNQGNRHARDTWDKTGLWEDGEPQGFVTRPEENAEEYLEVFKKFCLEYAMKVIKVPSIVEDILACQKAEAGNMVNGCAHYEGVNPQNFTENASKQIKCK